MPARERDPSALLIERLLGDAGFRDRFRGDPVAAFREAGIEGPPEELSRTATRAMETLEIRESRSSLAGVMVAGAVEALAGFALADHVSEASASGMPHGHGAASAADNAHVSGGPEHLDPGQNGQPRTRGPPSPETLALLRNHDVVFDAAGKADLRSGRIDPRIVSVLTEVAKKHHIAVSCTSSDHPKLTTGGAGSKHFFRRGGGNPPGGGQPGQPRKTRPPPPSGAPRPP